MIKVIEIGQGTRQVEIALNLTPAEYAALTSLTATIQKPSGDVVDLQLAKSQVIDNVLYFVFNFDENGDFTVQTTLNYSSNKVTSEDALVLNVKNPIKQATLRPLGKYISKQDLEVYLEKNRLIELSDRKDGETSDNPKIQQSIEFAENLVESYLAYGYKMPLLCSDGKAPASIKQYLIDICVFNMMEQRATEEVLYRYEKALEFLEKVAKGMIILICSDGTSLQKSQIKSPTQPVFAYSFEKINDCGCSNV